MSSCDSHPILFNHNSSLPLSFCCGNYDEGLCWEMSPSSFLTVRSSICHSGHSLVIVESVRAVADECHVAWPESRGVVNLQRKGCWGCSGQGRKASVLWCLCGPVLAQTGAWLMTASSSPFPWSLNTPLNSLPVLRALVNPSGQRLVGLCGTRAVQLAAVNFSRLSSAACDAHSAVN